MRLNPQHGQGLQFSNRSLVHGCFDKTSLIFLFLFLMFSCFICDSKQLTLLTAHLKIEWSVMWHSWDLWQRSRTIALQRLWRGTLQFTHTLDLPRTFWSGRKRKASNNLVQLYVKWIFAYLFWHLRGSWNRLNLQELITINIGDPGAISQDDTIFSGD